MTRPEDTSAADPFPAIHRERMERWLKTSPRYAAFAKEWSTVGRKRSGDPEQTAHLLKVWNHYVSEHNAFMRQPAVAHAKAMLLPATRSLVITLAEKEHSFISGALRKPGTREKQLHAFYCDYWVRLYQQLLPSDTAPGAYCTSRHNALFSVKSWETWDDKAFYQSGVLRLMQLRGQLGIEPQQPPPPPIVNVPPQKAVVRTVERDADGVISRLIDTPVEG
jgi:hypothetical protein